jgi:hypothetical protein
VDLITTNEVQSKQQLLSILSGLTACGLTKLSLDGSYSPLLDLQDAADDPEQQMQLAAAHDAAGGPVAVCSRLAGLTTLKDLAIHYGNPDYEFPDVNDVPGDAMALTALTGLTRLVITGPTPRGVSGATGAAVEDSGAVVDDLAATALAWNLRQLRHLELSRCSLGSMACLVVIGQVLTQLTELQLGGNDGITQRGLMQLTKLQKLRRLGVDRNDEVTDAVLEESSGLLCLWCG